MISSHPTLEALDVLATLSLEEMRAGRAWLAAQTRNTTLPLGRGVASAGVLLALDALIDGADHGDVRSCLVYALNGAGDRDVLLTDRLAALPRRKDSET
jgi:hypothetical protein